MRDFALQHQVNELGIGQKAAPTRNRLRRLGRVVNASDRELLGRGIVVNDVGDAGVQIGHGVLLDRLPHISTTVVESHVVAGGYSGKATGGTGQGGSDGCFHSTSLTRLALSWIIAATAFLATPAFADDANILELQLEIQRLLDAQQDVCRPVEIIKPVEIVPDVSKESESGDTSAKSVEAIDTPKPQGRIIPAMVYVGASWCNPCRQTRPVVEQLRRDGFNVHFKDADRDARWLRTYHVSSLPTVILFDSKGREIRRTGGQMGRSQLLAFAGRESLPDRLFYAETRSTGGVAPVGVVTARSAPVRVVATSAVARRGEREHSHLCSNCGREWWHRSSEAGPGSHNCPNCRRPQYVINRWR